MRYAWEACDALLRDTPSVVGLRKPDGDPHARWDVAVIDGAYPECLLGILHGENVPTIMLNTVISGRSASSGRNRKPIDSRGYKLRSATFSISITTNSPGLYCRRDDFIPRLLIVCARAIRLFVTAEMLSEAIYRT